MSHDHSERSSLLKFSFPITSSPANYQTLPTPPPDSPPSSFADVISMSPSSSSHRGHRRMTDSISSVDHWVADDVLQERRRSEDGEMKIESSASAAAAGAASENATLGMLLSASHSDVTGADETAQDYLGLASEESLGNPSSATDSNFPPSGRQESAARRRSGQNATDKEPADKTQDPDLERLSLTKKLEAAKRKGRITPLQDFLRRLNSVVLIVESSYGRDKLLKCFQYSARTYLYLYLLLSRRLGPYGFRPSWLWLIGKRLFARDKAHLDKMNAFVAGLSLARKCLLLFGPLAPLLRLLSPQPLSGVAFFNHTLALASACSDDIYCLSKLGVVSKRRGLWADRWANRFWLLKSAVEIIKLHAKGLALAEVVSGSSLPPLDERSSPEEAASRVAARDRIWSARKLYCDIVFSSYNVFSLEFLKEPIQCATGLAAGIISTSKLYDKHLLELIDKTA